jgi:hypothetical protein
VEMSGRAAGYADPLEKSAPSSRDKHTSLASLVGESWAFVLLEAGIDLRNVCRNVWETVGL